METFETHSVEESKSLARKFASSLPSGATICLYGDLAAGKTTFTQGLGEYFGISRMTSPTFIIMQQYPIGHKHHINYLYHLDFYRLSSLEEARSFDLEEIWADPKNLVVIEWPERISGHLPRIRYDIHFETISDTVRKITIQHIS